MKNILLFLPLVFISIVGFGQSAEFENVDNGLMYDSTTMSQLSFIVDSLNLKFKSCELDKVYSSIPQGIAHHVRVDSKDIKSAKKDLENNISFSDFLVK